MRYADSTALRLTFYVLASLLAVAIYFFGLDGQHIPRNGDEDVYQHITRLTAESGKLLPLQSQLDHMRNTKPPLLFWQGIAATRWGQEWTLWNLRYPSVIYTLLTAMMVFLLARKLSRRWETGFVALLTYLAFFSTYRYGRPFLTNPPEVFWLFLPFFVLLYWHPKAFASSWRVPLLLGSAIGIGLLYKSFALLLPVGLTLAWWYWREREYQLGAFVSRDVPKLLLVAGVALLLFALWFVLDPEPRAIWQEFVVGENVGKFDPHGDSYVVKLLWGGSSVWRMVAEFFFANAGFLAFPVAALFVLAYRQRGEMGAEEKLLWIWVITLFVVFSLPSQRSSRYLMDAMPAIAVLCALHWQQISRKAFVLSLVMAGALLALFIHISLRLQQESGGVLYGMGYWVLLGATAVFLVSALLVPRLTRPGVNLVILLVFAILAALLQPLNGALGNFSPQARQFAQGRDVWVPCNFRAKDEGYHFILPGARIHGYDEHQGPSAAALAQRYPLFAVRQLPGEDCAGCQVIGERTDLRSRHSDAQLKAMLLEGQLFQLLFVKEYLVAAPGTGAAVLRAAGPEECR